jgi:hypothetical protein
MRMVLLALAILVVAAPAQARSLRLVDDGPAVAASTDGRFVAATRSGSVGAGVRVLDPRTGRLRNVDTPPGCTFAAVGARSLLWNCGDSTQPSGRTLDLRSGAVGELPVLTPDPATSEAYAAYVSLGRRWAGAVRAGYHYAFPVYVRRTGGLEHRAPRAANVSLRGGPTSSLRLGAASRLVGAAGRRVYLVSGHRLRHVTL